MKQALIISGIFHVSLLVFAAMDIPWFDQVENVEMEIIPVEMVDISEVTRTFEIAKEPEPLREKPKPPERQPQRVDNLPPPPPRMPSTMPLPKQTAEAPAEKPKPPVQRAEAPRVTPKSKPRPPSRLDLAALRNLVPERSLEERIADKLGPQEQRATSLDVQRQTMTISAAIRKKIEDQCWNPPVGADTSESLRVTVQVFLAPTGELARPPVAEDYARMNGFLKVAADSALRAVRMCAPYNDINLPKDMYDQWKEIKMNFDPSDMVS